MRTVLFVVAALLVLSVVTYLALPGLTIVLLVAAWALLFVRHRARAALNGPEV